MTDRTLDELGPVDYLVVEFPFGTARFTGVIEAELNRLVGAGTIRVIELLVLIKHPDGRIESMEMPDLAGRGSLSDLEAKLAQRLVQDDVLNLTAAMDPGSTAGVLVYENLWAAPFASAVRHSGGRLIANGRIPIQAIAAAMTAGEAGETDGA